MVRVVVWLLPQAQVASCHAEQLVEAQTGICVHAEGAMCLGAVFGYKVRFATTEDGDGGGCWEREVSAGCYDFAEPLDVGLTCL